MLQSLDTTNSLFKQTDDDDVLDEPRLHYDQNKIRAQGRNKTQLDMNKGGTLGLLEEVVNWAVTATVRTPFDTKQVQDITLNSDHFEHHVNDREK